MSASVTPSKTCQSGSPKRTGRTSFNETVKIIPPQSPMVRKEGRKSLEEKGGGEGKESTMALKDSQERRSESKESQKKKKGRRPFWRKRNEQRDPSKKSEQGERGVHGRSPTPSVSSKSSASEVSQDEAHEMMDDFRKWLKANDDEGLVWHGLIVLGLNYLWAGCKQNGLVCHREPTASQSACLKRLWEVVKNFVDDTSEVKEKLVKSPGREAWKGKLDSFRVSYQGEVVEKAQKLTLARILPGLPPVGYGGKVNILELCEGRVREMLEDPEKVMLSGDELPMELPKPKVLADDEEWGKICRVLYERGLVRPVENCASLDGVPIENGAFGVIKPGKNLESGEPILRLIMDFRACNSVTRIIEGDVKTLAGAPSLQHLVLPEGTVLRISAEDLVAAFYLFAIPPSWSKLMTFQKLVTWKQLGVDREGSVRVGSAVLPMGWSSAVGVMQHAHRRLNSPLSGAGLLGDLEIRRDSVFPLVETDGCAAWSLYLDDTSILEILEKKVAAELEGKTPPEQDQLRKAYTHWGIPYSVEKALSRAKTGEKLGAVIHGDLGQLRAASRRAAESISLGSWLCEKIMVPKKAAQIYAGKEVHTLQFRRPLFCIFDYLWKGIGSSGDTLRMNRKIVEEILLCGCLQGLKFTDLRSGLDGVVTASDASETGGGTVYSNRLSSKGLSDVIALEEGLNELPETKAIGDEPQMIMVFDFFAGIGGLSRALEMAKIPVAHLVIIEKDSDCRRLHRRRWPAGTIWTDIKRVTKEQIRREMMKLPGLTGVVAGGGSPCQGLSKLSSLREHLDDPRSALFYDLVERLKWIQEICHELGIWSLRFCENVVGDEADVEEMSRSLQMHPVEVCASNLSWVRRPRLYWGSVEIEDDGSFIREDGPVADRLVFEEERERLGSILEPGFGWPGHELDPGLRLPTFTRAIPRSRPPPQPAGIKGCDEETLRRWREAKMMYPPYTFRPEFLFRNEATGESRVANASEREMLMGFKRGYTLALFKKVATDDVERWREEVCRCAALGNSFHCPTVAVLLDLRWLWSRKVRTDLVGAKAILARWHQEMQEISQERFHRERGDESGINMSESEAESLALLPERRMYQPKWLVPSEEWREAEKLKQMSQTIVHHYLRRMEFRGSDVRLDLGLLFKPDSAPRTSIDPGRWIWSVAHAYPFRTGEHINILELRSILHALEWRARTGAFHSTRFLHLSDSQICLAVLTKGRSSSRKLNRILRRIASLCLALNLYPLWAWVESRLNPADEPSRRYAEGHQK